MSTDQAAKKLLDSLNLSYPPDIPIGFRDSEFIIGDKEQTIIFKQSSPPKNIPEIQSSIRFQNINFQGNFSLQAIQIKGELQFRDCQFHKISLQNLKISGHLKFLTCQFQEISEEFGITEENVYQYHSNNWPFDFPLNDFRELNIRDDLIFQGCNIYGQTDMYRSKIGGYLRFISSKPWNGEKKHTNVGRFFLKQAKLSRIIIDKDSRFHTFLSLEDSKISQEADLRGSFKTLYLNRTYFQNALNFSGATVRRLEAKDLWVEGTFQALNTTFERQADFSLATFSGIVNLSKSTFQKGARFVDTSFKRNTFFENARLGAFSIFRRCSFDEILNFDIHEESLVIWEDILLRGPLRGRSFSSLKEFNGYWRERFLVWDNKPAIQISSSGLPDLSEQIQNKLLEKYGTKAKNQYPSNKTPILRYQFPELYDQYLQEDIVYWLNTSKEYKIVSERPVGKTYEYISANHDFEELQSETRSFFIEQTQNKMKEYHQRLLDKEHICEALKQGYQLALLEDEEDWAFQTSREAEQERLEGEAPIKAFWLNLQSYTGYGTDPTKTFKTILIGCGTLLILRLILTVWSSGPDSIFVFFKILLASETDPENSGISLDMLDLLISIGGLFATTFLIIAISHKIIRK